VKRQESKQKRLYSKQKRQDSNEKRLYRKQKRQKSKQKRQDSSRRVWTASS
jgi:hypothetical protein